MGFLPSSAAFFDHFAAQAKLLRAAIDRLTSAEANHASEAHERILACESEIQAIGDRTLAALRTTFLTPLDRDDLFAILQSIETVASAIAAAATVTAAAAVAASLPAIDALRGASRETMYILCDALTTLKDDKAHDAVRAECDRARKAARAAEHARRGAVATVLRDEAPHLATLAACDALGRISERALVTIDAIEAALLDA